MSYEQFTDDEIKRRSNSAFNDLMSNDGFLLEYGAHERSVAHKLAEYLQKQFRDRHVDCEYNLHGYTAKVLYGVRECDEDRKTDRIYPDVIVHIRGTDEYNVLVIEVKTGNGSRQCDIRKLELLTDPKNDYGYQLGLFIKFNGLSEPETQWFP